MLSSVSSSQICEEESYSAIQSSDRLKEIIAELQRSLESQDTWSPLSFSEFHLEIDETGFAEVSKPVSSPAPSNTLVNKEGVNNPSGEKRESSAEGIIRIAAAHFIQQSATAEADPGVCSHVMDPSLLRLSVEEIRNVGLASLLLAAAEKVSYRQYDRASYLLSQCYKFSSRSGNPVQRVVYYFSEALQERMERITEEQPPKRSREKRIPAQDTYEKFLTDHKPKLALHGKLPFAQLIQFTSAQNIIDSLASAKRIHLIDLSIVHGLHWTILIHELATRPKCPIDYLKISAVGTSEEAINETGKRLVSFAKTLDLRLDFKKVIITDMIDLKEDMFEVEEDEELGVYSALDMSRIVVRPQSLENLMRVLRALKPSILAVTDVEAKHNSPNFISRFTEALFYYSAMFDSFDGSMDRNDANRIFVEETFFLEAIKSIIATEGCERVVRHVGLSVWRRFFERFGFVETELNELTLFQAKLLVKGFVHGSSYTLGRSEKSLLIGWKGTPLFFISAWKFIRKDIFLEFI